MCVVLILSRSIYICIYICIDKYLCIIDAATAAYADAAVLLARAFYAGGVCSIYIYIYIYMYIYIYIYIYMHSYLDIDLDGWI